MSQSTVCRASTTLSSDSEDDLDSRKEKYQTRLEDCQKDLDKLIGMEVVTEHYNCKKRNIKWTVVKENIAPEPFGVCYPHSLGIRNLETLREIKSSKYLLAKIHLMLLFKNGDWQTPLAKMNAAIEEHNREETIKNPRFREMNPFSKEEFITCHGLLIGASSVLERGINLWPTHDEINTPNNPWNTIAATTDLNNYIPYYRFKIFKRFIPTVWEDPALKLTQDPWWRFQSAVNDFNNICRNDILTSTSRVLDESMSSF